MTPVRGQHQERSARADAAVDDAPFGQRLVGTRCGTVAAHPLHLLQKPVCVRMREHLDVLLAGADAQGAHELRIVPAMIPEVRLDDEHHPAVLYTCIMQVNLRDALKTLRRRCRSLLSRVLARLIGTREYATTLQPDLVSSVLVCRLNGRIGNTMFLTPLIRQLHASLPHAAIDLAVAYPRAAELLGSLPGVRRVVTFPHRAPYRIWRYVTALRSLRAQSYSLVIDPIPESTSGHVLLSLARAHYRLGFAGPNQWAPLTHAVPVPPQIVHRALQPVFLVCQVLGSPYPPPGVQLSLALSQEELAAGRLRVAQVIGPGRVGATHQVFGFFAHATHLKAVGRDWWLAFWKAFLELEPLAIPVEFLPSPSSEPTSVQFASVHIPSTRALTAAIAATRVFISPDAGPMHLGSSTAVPTVGLFHVTDPALFGPLKAADQAIDIGRYSPLETAQRCQRIWHAADNASLTHSSDMTGGGAACSSQ